MVLSAKMGYNFTVVCPRDYAPKKDVLEKSLEAAKKSGSRMEVTHDIYGAVKDATALYTDVWTSMGQESESEKRKHDFAAYQINSEVISRTIRCFSFALPAGSPRRGNHKWYFDSEHSIADEAENRLHVRKQSSYTYSPEFGRQIYDRGKNSFRDQST